MVGIEMVRVQPASRTRVYMSFRKELVSGLQGSKLFLHHHTYSVSSGLGKT